MKAKQKKIQLCVLQKSALLLVLRCMGGDSICVHAKQTYSFYKRALQTRYIYIWSIYLHSKYIYIIYIVLDLVVVVVVLERSSSTSSTRSSSTSSTSSSSTRSSGSSYY